VSTRFFSIIEQRRNCLGGLINSENLQAFEFFSIIEQNPNCLGGVINETI